MLTVWTTSDLCLWMAHPTQDVRDQLLDARGGRQSSGAMHSAASRRSASLAALLGNQADESTVEKVQPCPAAADVPGQPANLEADGEISTVLRFRILGARSTPAGPTLCSSSAAGR